MSVHELLVNPPPSWSNLFVNSITVTNGASGGTGTDVFDNITVLG